MKKKPGNILIVGSPAIYPDMRYAAGFFSSDPVIFLKTGKKKYLVVSPLDFGHVRRIAGKLKVLSLSDFPVAKKSKSPGCDRIACLLKKMNAGAVAVPAYFPVGLADKLGKKGIKISICDDAVFPEREIKTQKEINFISQAQRAACRAMDAAIALIAGADVARNRSLKIGRKPLTSADIRKTIDNRARDFGCVCRGTIVACGKQAFNPHETGWGTLRADEPIVIDIFPQHIASGYWGDLTRTVARGNPAPEIRKMYSAVLAAHHLAVTKVRAGVPAEKIHNTAVELFGEKGFKTGNNSGFYEGFIHGIGHGVGLEIHENPRVASGGKKLQTGNVITIEPGLYYRDKAGIRIEDTILVTRDSGRILAPYHYKFIV